jgi:hypothetical protein
LCSYCRGDYEDPNLEDEEEVEGLVEEPKEKELVKTDWVMDWLRRELPEAFSMDRSHAN